MNTLKELLNKIYLDLQDSDRIKEYPGLTDKKLIANELEAIALAVMPSFIADNMLDEFSSASDENYSEATFRKYIADYSEFLDNVEQQFYNGLLVWLVEG